MPKKIEHASLNGDILLIRLIDVGSENILHLEYDIHDFSDAYV